jgi:hypothetical protein
MEDVGKDWVGWLQACMLMVEPAVALQLDAM